jgi:acyl-CoA synthetase (AMP-forming)/AMP-acid ligase II
MDLITDTTYRNVTLAQVAAARAQERPDEIALRFDSGHTLSFADAWRQGSALAAQIQRLGITPGATLTFQLPNIPESVPVAIAASICGLVINPVVPIYRGKELGFILNDARSEIVFIPHRIRGFDYVEMIATLRPSLPHLKHVICCGAEEALPDDILSYEALMANPSEVDADVATVDPNDTKVVLYTSGTTGNPKKALKTNS